jgi:2-polyprenyl-6-methoxyphenol hydroxylase-like FAD-dependent oxidoreductase
MRSQTRPDIETPVLIVGAGPAGLVAAIALAREGIDCLVVERRRERSTLPRATAISTRSMEIFRSWGLEEELRRGSVEVEWMQWHCRTLAEVDAGEGTPTGYPTSAQAALVSPTAPACVPQDHLEPLLMSHLESLPAGRLLLGTEVVSVSTGQGGARATIRDAAGRLTRIEAAYAIGADGAHSGVRAELGIEMQGEEDLMGAVSVLFRAPLWEMLGPHRYGLYAAAHPEAEGVFLPAGPGDRWLYGVLVPSGSAGPGEDEGALLARIRTAAGVSDMPASIERIGSFSFAALHAESYRAGDVFLAGDAAHRVTPRGGTGMNTAIHDGFDLGWKLGWVLRGWAGADLLASYEAERRPIAEHNVRRSADPSGTKRDASREIHADIGGRIPHVWVLRGDSSASSLDLLGPGLTLFTGPDGGHGSGSPAPAGVSAPIKRRRLDAVAARAIGVPAGGGLFVRPDGVPVAATPASPSRGLRSPSGQASRRHRSAASSRGRGGL